MAAGRPSRLRGHCETCGIRYEVERTSHRLVSGTDADATAYEVGRCPDCRLATSAGVMPKSPLGHGTATLTREEWEAASESKPAPAAAPVERIGSADLAAMKARLGEAIGLGVLTGRELQAFLLRADGRSWRDIGDALGISHGAARVLYVRAQEKIAAAIGDSDTPLAA